MSNIKDAIQSLIDGNTSDFKDQIDAALKTKAADRIEVSRIEVGQNMFNNTDEEEMADEDI